MRKLISGREFALGHVTTKRQSWGLSPGWRTAKPLWHRIDSYDANTSKWLMGRRLPQAHKQSERSSGRSGRGRVLAAQLASHVLMFVICCTSTSPQGGWEDVVCCLNVQREGPSQVIWTIPGSESLHRLPGLTRICQYVPAFGSGNMALIGTRENSIPYVM